MSKTKQKKKENAYERYQAYQDRIKVIDSGKGMRKGKSWTWIASKTMLIIDIPNGYLIFPLRV